MHQVRPQVRNMLQHPMVYTILTHHSSSPLLGHIRQQATVCTGINRVAMHQNERRDQVYMSIVWLHTTEKPYINRRTQTVCKSVDESFEGSEQSFRFCCIYMCICGVQCRGQHAFNVYIECMLPSALHSAHPIPTIMTATGTLSLVFPCPGVTLPVWAYKISSTGNCYARLESSSARVTQYLHRPCSLILLSFQPYPPSSVFTPLLLEP